MAITYGNPIIITSGTYTTQMPENYKVDRVYWHQPGLQVSGVIIKHSVSGANILELGVEVSGQSQTMNFRCEWWNRPFVQQVPTGTLYIYTK